MKNLLILFSFITISVSQQSRIELHSHFSHTLGITKSYNIFLPEGYDAETDHYPVVYLFRGAVDEWADPMEDASRRGTIKTVFDSLYAKKRIGKMILVMPGLSAPATTNEYTYIADDLIPYIDSVYRTIPTRWHRAMDGFSLGGLIVTNLMAGAPLLFCSAGSYDGTLSLFNNTLFSNASPTLIYALSQMQLLYHTASVGGNNNSNNVTTFSILNSKGIFNTFPTFVLDPGSSHNWYYADWHMGITLPLHWKRMNEAGNSLNAQFLTAFDGQKLSGTVFPSWQIDAAPQTVGTLLFVSSNNGATWTKLLSTTDSVTQYTWNTLLHPDGTLYRLKLMTAADTLFGHDEMLPFIVDNPGNAVPDIHITDLDDTLRGAGSIGYYAADADGDPLTLTISVSYDDGKTWRLLDSGVTPAGTYPIDFTVLPNSNAVRISITAYDGTASATALSERRVIANKRYPLASVDIVHRTGNSDAIITITTSDPSSIIQNTYDIVVNEVNGKKSYSVKNSEGAVIVSNADELDGVTEGPLFGGMRLLIRDYVRPAVLHDSTRWIIGTSPLSGYTSLVDLYMESDTVIAVPSPYDYEIRISDSIVDTTLGLYGTVAMPVPFSVWNTTLNRKAQVVFVEIDMSGWISRNDEIFIIEKDEQQKSYLSWHIQFIGNIGVPNPAGGDLFKVRILKPLTANDSYRFVAMPTSAIISDAGPAQFIVEQNFPNPFNPTTSIRFAVPYATDLSLTIYDLLGREIAVLVNKTVSKGVYTIEWNAAGVASGVYFCLLRSGHYTHIRKMVLLR